jgi:hypothetical protein
MENEMVSSTTAPEAQVTVAPTQTTSSQSANDGDSVFENMSSQKPMDLKSILLFGLLIAFSIYGNYILQKSNCEDE